MIKGIKEIDQEIKQAYTELEALPIIFTEFESQLHDKYRKTVQTAEAQNYNYKRKCKVYEEYIEKAKRIIKILYGRRNVHRPGKYAHNK